MICSGGPNLIISLITTRPPAPISSCFPRYLPDIEPLADVHTQIVRPGQGGHKLQRGGAEAAHYAVRAAHEDVVRAQGHAIRRRGLECTNNMF